MSQTSRTVPVSERALAARIARQLAKQDQVLRRCSRSSRWHSSLGDYYVVDTHTNGIAEQDVSLFELAADLGCIKPWERLADA